jgi:hypothetical protein
MRGYPVPLTALVRPEDMDELRAYDRRLRESRARARSRVVSLEREVARLRKELARREVGG